MLNEYIDQIQHLIRRLQEEQKKEMYEAAERIALAIGNGGIVHLFGAGHSHILTEEVFYRAGGLVPIHPILEESLMLHEGAVRSSTLERQNDLAATFMNDQDIRPSDVVFVISTSGRNPVPVDAALIAKEKGAYVIGITSLKYSKSQPSRHKDGYHLYDVVDLVLDNLSEKGDALLKHEQLDVPFAPSSTVMGATMLQAILAESINQMIKRGIEPPVLLSGNIDGSDEHNHKLIEKYKDRIPLLG